MLADEDMGAASGTDGGARDANGDGRGEDSSAAGASVPQEKATGTHSGGKKLQRVEAGTVPTGSRKDIKKEHAAKRTDTERVEQDKTDSIDHST